MSYVFLLARKILFKRKGSVTLATTAVAATIFLNIFTSAVFGGVATGIVGDISTLRFGDLLVTYIRGEITTPDYSFVRTVSSNPAVQGVTPRLIATSNINFSTNTGVTSKYGVETLGVDPRLEVSATKLRSTLISGNLNHLYQNTVILGAHVADNLGVGPGKYVIVKILGVDGTYHIKRLLVVGISRHPGFSGFDDSAIININTMRAMTGVQNGHSTSFIIKLNAPNDADGVKEWVQARFPKLTVQTITEGARNFLASINQVVVFINIVGYAGMAASALGVITILTMMVTGKTRDVGLLRALGIQRLEILQIFITDGAIIGGIGAAAGGIAGTLTTLYLQSSNVPIFGDFPLQVTFTPNLLIFPTAIGFLISIVSALYPAWKAASYKPVEAMRYF